MVRWFDVGLPSSAQPTALLVASSALLVAGFGASKFASSAVDAWADGKELVFGLLLLGIILLGYGIARRVSQAAVATAAVR